MSEYTPSTEHIESVYGRVHDTHGIPVQSQERRAEFRRWLAAHDAEVRAEAWDQGAEMGHRLYAEPMSVITARNPYRKEEG
ncbi:hypothetical protein [Pseudactinotalea sp.]|uniref:hypothetical protein n=1 Tax=Pseudactinotalea sp. TaxID=1926260 RepID=UPI003B3B4902